VGGHGDLFDVDAHLYGISPLSSYEHDVLAYALNERLDDLCRGAQVPYVTPGAPEPVKDLEDAVAELLNSLPFPSPSDRSPPSSATDS
jgi:hypothetical protein